MENTTDTNKNSSNIISETLKAGFDKAFSFIKKASAAIIVCIMLLTTMIGCNPTEIDVNKMSEIARSAGYTTALVLNETDIPNKTRNVIVDIMNRVVISTPEVNQTFSDAWMPIARAHVHELVESGVMDDGEGDIVVTAFNVITKAIDYIFTVKYPDARQYKELVSAAIHGFSDTFLYAFKPADVKALSAGMMTFDNDLYQYLK